MENKSHRTKPKPKYIYAIIDESLENSPLVTGILDKKVHLVPMKKMAAVVSNVKQKAIRPKRRNLAAHQRVLTTLLNHCTPLPMTFGIIADNSSAIKKAIISNEDLLEEAFSRVHGKVEMGLRVALKVSNIFELYTNTNDSLRVERDRLYGENSNPNRDEKIGLGSLFDQLLTTEREQHTMNVEAALIDCCSELKREKCRDENILMDMACLIKRGEENKLEKNVRRIAKQFDNTYEFKLNGPWVPHSFVDLNLDI